MKNTAINTLGYTGMVTISQYIGTKKVEIAKIHNAGGNPLFNFLADCLKGDFDVAKVSRPTKIMLLTRVVDGESYSYVPASRFIYLRSKPEKVYSTTEGIVRYSFMISRDILTSTDFNGIGLYADSATKDDISKFSAFCEIKDLGTVTNSSVLVLDWELVVHNAETSLAKE
jgi:hypothetical protein